MDPLTGWVQIRPYNQETWSYIRARFRCPVLLLSATMEEKSLQRIAGKWIANWIYCKKYFQKTLTFPEMKSRCCTNPQTGRIFMNSADFL